MDTKNIERYLESFGKQVVNRSKANLGKKKGGSTQLAKTIRFEVQNISGGFTVKFFMADYGAYLDKGVSGTQESISYKDYQNKTIKSPYKYTNKQPPSGILQKWIKKKGLKGRDKKTGRFITNKSFAFLIARSIKKNGIKSLSFFQKPLGLGIKQFGGELLSALSEDIASTLVKFKKIK